MAVCGFTACHASLTLLAVPCLCMTQSQAEPTGLAWRHVTGWLSPPVTGGSRPLQPVSVSMHREGKRGELAGLGLWKGLCGGCAWCSCHRNPSLPPPPPPLREPAHTLCPPRLLCCSLSSSIAVPRGQASAGDIDRWELWQQWGQHSSSPWQQCRNCSSGQPLHAGQQWVAVGAHQRLGSRPHSSPLA
jgi:hypothetical protein